MPPDILLPTLFPKCRSTPYWDRHKMTSIETIIFSPVIRSSTAPIFILAATITIKKITRTIITSPSQQNVRHRWFPPVPNHTTKLTDSLQFLAAELTPPILNFTPCHRIRDVKPAKRAASKANTVSDVSLEPLPLSTRDCHDPAIIERRGECRWRGPRRRRITGGAIA